MRKAISDKLPTIPDYYKKFVDPAVDLNLVKSLPCPFHREKTGKSFSYSKELGVWRCWGQCHCGGDVIDLHNLNYGFKSRDKAKESLFKLYDIKMEETLTFEQEEVEVNPKDVYRRRVYSLAVQLATEPDSWLELDYILSKVPYDVRELEVFCASKGHPISQSNLTPN